MRRTVTALAFTAAALALAAPAAAATWVFGSPLQPEAPGATGTGEVTVTFDSDARTLEIMSNWSGLSGQTTIAHIHCCVAAPGTAGIAVTPGTLPGFPMGTSSGFYSALLDLSNPSTYTANFLNTFGGGTTEGAQAALLAGLQDETAYFNIHTTTFPAGEIRGFTSAIPEPESWGLMILGFGMVGAALRRKGSEGGATRALTA